MSPSYYNLVGVRGMWGLGDNIYQRPFVRELSQRCKAVYLETPWPDLYEDLPNVKYVMGHRGLRTQTQNIRRHPANRWTSERGWSREISVGYSHLELQTSSIPDVVARCFGSRWEDVEWDLPASLTRGPAVVKPDRPIALVRPVTVREEWRNQARNCLPEYVAQVAEWLSEDYHVVVVAHLAEGHEWALEPMPEGDEAFLEGELNVRQLLNLVAHVAVVVGPVGWIVPAALALRKPAFVVLGGQGGYNSPKMLVPRTRGDCVHFATPDNFCLCGGKFHACDKRISNLRQQYQSWRDSLAGQSRSRAASPGGPRSEPATCPP